ncbi:hypothetical protein [Endozoicomonas lisbonensis]
MNKTNRLGGLLSSGLLTLTLSTQALPNTAPIPEQESSVSFSAVPYAFQSEDWGTAVGASGIVTGWLQPQMSVFATGIASNNGSWLGFLGMSNLMIPGQSQWLVDLQLLNSYYDATNYYVSGNPDYDGEQAGSNDSSADNYIRTSGKESHYYARFRYILPIGDGVDGALASMMHRKGETNHESGTMNPFSNGFTTLEIRPFYRRQDLGEAMPAEDDTTARGAHFILDYDNRDSTQEPTTGNHLEFRVTQDWGSKNRNSWRTWELGFSQFFDMGDNHLWQQQVVALNGWIADTPTWNKTETVNGVEEYRRPSSFSGVSLGGWHRLRGYSSNRFHGRSAVSYSAEYRVKPHWQPLQQLPLLGDWYELPWWQWTVFADAGRVADTFSARELHSDMKYSVGAGIRFKAEGVTARAEIATSEEGSRFIMFINQPF